jgi:hypothetical protein
MNERISRSIKIKNGPKTRFVPLKLVFMLALSILACYLIIKHIFIAFPDLSLQRKSFAASIIIAVLLMPILYFGGHTAGPCADR